MSHRGLCYTMNSRTIADNILIENYNAGLFDAMLEIASYGDFISFYVIRRKAVELDMREYE